MFPLLKAKADFTGTSRCMDCHQTFAYRQSRRTATPHLCEACRTKRARAGTRAWQLRKRAEREREKAGRTCPGCGTPIPEGRSDRVWCGSPCRQRAYRQRKG
jgi:hypothetical protein